MSVPDSSQGSLKISTVVDIEVPAVGQVASVEIGPADVFALDADGVRLPLATIASGGVLPNINANLLPKKTAVAAAATKGKKGSASQEF